MDNSQKNIIISEEKFIIALLLTFIGGFLDAYTYILYDGMLSNTQTGNLIFLAIFITEGSFNWAFMRIIPILAFGLAIIIAEILIFKLGDKGNLWRKIVLIMNSIILTSIGFGIYSNMIFVSAIISFVCAIQIVAFRKFEGNVFASIMCTGNLRSCIECLSKCVIYKDRSNGLKFLKYLIILIIFCLGVSSGIILAKQFGIFSIFLCSIITICIVFLLSIN